MLRSTQGIISYKEDFYYEKSYINMSNKIYKLGDELSSNRRSKTFYNFYGELPIPFTIGKIITVFGIESRPFYRGLTKPYVYPQGKIFYLKSVRCKYENIIVWEIEDKESVTDAKLQTIGLDGECNL